MAWRNSVASYGTVSIFLHWVSALLIFFLLAEGMYMVTLTYYHPLYHRLPQWHKLVGLGVLALTLLRLLWALGNPKPRVLARARWQRLAAHGAHALMYVLLFALGVSGYFVTTAEGQGITLWASAQLPAFTVLPEPTANLLGILHRWFAYGLLGVIFLHVSAALKHHFVDKDATLLRILWPRSLSRGV